MQTFIDRLDALDDDQEMAHSRADDILLDALRAFPLGELADAYERVDDRCGGFWYA
jgi:hypothetical protein